MSDSLLIMLENYLLRFFNDLSKFFWGIFREGMGQFAGRYFNEGQLSAGSNESKQFASGQSIAGWGIFWEDGNFRVSLSKTVSLLPDINLLNISQVIH